MIWPKAQSPEASFGRMIGIDPHLAGERGDVSGRRAAGADQHEVARVIAALHRHAADAVHHVAVDDGEHAIGGALDRHAERIGDAS